jgi:hypothetical protein
VIAEEDADAATAWSHGDSPLRNLSRASIYDLSRDTGTTASSILDDGLFSCHFTFGLAAFGAISQTDHHHGSERQASG